MKSFCPDFEISGKAEIERHLSVVIVDHFCPVFVQKSQKMLFQMLFK